LDNFFSPSSFGAAAPKELGEKKLSNPVASSEKFIKDVRRATRRIYNAEQKIIIVLEGMRAETTVKELCRKYGIAEPTYYKWNKEFIEAGKSRLAGDEVRGATFSEVEDLRQENKKIKESLGDLLVRFDILKKIQKMREQYPTNEDI
jgi:transposase